MPQSRLSAPQHLSAFLGTWQFERWIDDRRAGQGIAASGTARITSDQTAPGRAVYAEEARMCLPGQPPLQAKRRYLLEADGAEIRFFFDDGRFFHVLDLSAPTPTDHHACDPDSYDVAYDLTVWPRWRATWTVTGPRKDYVMTTTFTRQPHNRP